MRRSRKALLAIPRPEYDQLAAAVKYRLQLSPENRRGLKQAVNTVLERASNALSPKVSAANTRQSNMPRFLSPGDSLVDKPGAVHIESEEERPGNKRIKALAAGRGVKGASARVAERFTPLLECKDKPTLLLSDFADPGKTMTAVENVLQDLGFNSLNHAAFVVTWDNTRTPNTGRQQTCGLATRSRTTTTGTTRRCPGYTSEANSTMNKRGRQPKETKN